jgi:flagellar biosynthetic protein FliR
MPETQEIFVYLAVFARVGTMMMLMPVFGEISVTPRVRLSIALALCLVLAPLVRPLYPAEPAIPSALAGILFGEIAVGILIGTVARMLVQALQVAGTIFAFQTGLGFAQSLDPAQGAQSALLGTFLTLLGVTLIVVTDLHHLLIGALRGSYALFAPGRFPDLDNAAELVTDTVAGTFALAVELSAPFLVFGLVFYLAAGVISKLMPQIQIFFVAMPANILLGLALFMLLVGTLMTWFLDDFQEQLRPFLG